MRDRNLTYARPCVKKNDACKCLHATEHNLFLLSLKIFSSNETIRLN